VPWPGCLFVCAPAGLHFSSPALSCEESRDEKRRREKGKAKSTKQKAKTKKQKQKERKEKKGGYGESNPRPCAPKAQIIPLDHIPEFLFVFFLFFFCWCSLYRWTKRNKREKRKKKNTERKICKIEFKPKTRQTAPLHLQPTCAPTRQHSPHPQQTNNQANQPPSPLCTNTTNNSSQQYPLQPTNLTCSLVRVRQPARTPDHEKPTTTASQQ
jgi:hypothetical protein